MRALCLALLVCSAPLVATEVVQDSPPKPFGVFDLTEVSGERVPTATVPGALGGTVVFESSGLVERRVSYLLSTQGAVLESLASGTFEVREDTIELLLGEREVAEEDRWRMLAILEGDTLVLRHLALADEPVVVEVYLRRNPVRSLVSMRR